ncbi:hypothetical protein G7046_g5493 [Stylonectria norvegica]|nr:hypothetical protein G7046_g5493 [Stylonectria norvegica]
MALARESKPYSEASPEPHRRRLLVHPRHTDCVGWKCLTDAEKFGVVFSIVVTSVILILAYMYYLGRITDAHQEQMVAYRRGRRRRRVSYPPIINPGQLPVVQQWPTYPPRTLYQPVMYNAVGSGTLPSRPLMFPPPYPQQPTHIFYPNPISQQFQGQQFQGQPFQGQGQQPLSQPQNIHQAPGTPPPERHRRNFTQRNFRPPWPSPDGLPPRQPTWRQRLGRALGLPTGRASTIESSSQPGTPSHSRSPSTRIQDVAAGNATPRPSSNPSRIPSRPDTPRRATDRSHPPSLSLSVNVNHDVVDRAESPQTDAATVHSDDYQPVAAPSPVDERRGLAPDHRSSATTIDHVEPREHDSVLSDNDSGEEYYLPSVSSIRSDYSPKTRPAMLAFPRTDSGLQTASGHRDPDPIPTDQFGSRTTPL